MRWWCALIPLVTAAQVPRIGQINYYGLRKGTEQRIERVLHLSEGDPLPPSKAELEDRLEKIPGVVLARLEAVCCEGGGAILFIGVEEKGAPHFAFRSPPAGSATLPADLVKTHEQFLEAVKAAARRGSTAEDLTHGHSLMADPDAREQQQRFAVFAEDHLDLLRDVLRNSSEEEQRAMAATIIGYAPKKEQVVNDLEYAMQDPDEAVRANAMRALNAIAVLATREPELGIRISPTWFVEMLNSIVLSDRTRASTALVNLTEKNAQSFLEQIRERALGSVVEMARWKSLRYALPAYILAGRMAGMSEGQIHDTWIKGEREQAIEKVLAGGKKKQN